MFTSSLVPSFSVVDTPPRLDRPDAGLVAVTALEVGGPAQQRAVLDASARAWATLPWPRTLLGISWLLSFDGSRALAYVQWADDSEFATYAQTHRPVLAAAFRQAVPDVVLTPPTFYRPYRGARRPDGARAGAVVIVEVDFDGPDEARQRAWTDAVFAALESDAPPAGGRGIGSGPAWGAVQAFPGLTGSRVTRYRFERQLVPARTGERS
jgi:hypothetical protein